MDGGVTGRGFKPGQSGNPGGKVGIPQEVKDLLKQNRSSLTKLITELLEKSPDEWKALAEDKSQKGVMSYCARVLFQGWNKADVLRFDWIIRQACAPLPQKFEFTGEDGDEIKTKVTVEVVDYRANARKDLPNPEAK